VFGMGVAGRRGFAGVTGVDVGIINRYFEVDHGGFFTDEFMETQWVPLLTLSDRPSGSELVAPTAGWSAGLEYYADPLKLGILLAPVIIGVFWWYAQTVRLAHENELRLTAAAYQTLYEDPSQAVLHAFAATEIKSSPSARMALQTAYKVAVLHHHNRRDVSQLTGRGPSYLAARWKQGEIFSEASPDGRYRLVVTERGPDGPPPAGEVYLVNNETLAVTKIEPCSDWQEKGLRVEDVEFDRTSTRLFVSRYFTLRVYTLDGHCQEQYDFGRHTKSPVHLVAGYLGDRWILGAESKGGFWAVDIGLDPAKTIQLQREWHGDIAVAVNFSSSGRRAAVVFESGRAALISLGADGRPAMRDITKEHVLFAGFDPKDETTFVTAGDDGAVRLWKVSESAVSLTAEYSVRDAGIDWVTVSEDGRRLLLVGTNHTLYVLDRRTRETLLALNRSREIDWASARTGQDRPENVNIEPPVTPSETRPFPDDAMRVRAVAQAGGETWLLTDDGTDAIFHGGKPYRLVGNQAVAYAGVSRDVSSIERHGNLLWLKSMFEGTGPVFLIRDDELRPITNQFVANSILSVGGVSWLASNDGVYRFDGQRVVRLSRRRLPKSRLIQVGDQPWVLSERGAYIIDGDRLIRLTESFAHVRDVRLVGDRRWLLTNVTNVGGSLENGPAYRIDGYLGTAVPNHRMKVANVLSAAGHEWLATETGLYLVEGTRVHAVEGMSEEVSAALEVGNHVWLSTRSGIWPFRGPGPVYRLDIPNRRAVRTELGPSTEWRNIGGQTWIRYLLGDGRFAAARVEGETLTPADVQGASVGAIVEAAGAVWLATDRGAYRAAANRFVRVPDMDMKINSIIEVGEYTWLLADRSVVRIEARGHTVFPITGGAPHQIKQIDGETWILSGWSYWREGAAFRVEKTRAVPYPDHEGAVSDVVAVAGDAWLVSRQVDGGARPLIKVPKP